MVAKSFQKYEHGEPYLKNGRMYVKLSTGREVRWYNDAEYERMYPGEKVEVKRLRSVKDVLGLKKALLPFLRAMLMRLSFGCGNALSHNSIDGLDGTLSLLMRCRNCRLS